MAIIKFNDDYKETTTEINGSTFEVIELDHHILKARRNELKLTQEWTRSFGKQFYIHEQSLAALESQSEADWMLRLEGQLFETGKRPNVTPFEELRQYIKQELQASISSSVNATAERQSILP